MNQNLYVIGLLMTVALSLGCTRKASNSAAIALAVPSAVQTNNASNKVGAQSLPVGFELSHIIVNITGTKITKETTYSWDRCKEDDVCDEAPPAKITIDNLPPNTNLLIQYLGAYEMADNPDGSASSDDGIIVTYGEYLGSLNSGDNNITIEATTHGGTVSNVEAKIAGQYVTSVDVGGIPAGPTGKIRMGFSPGVGKPTMPIEYHEMFNGYFEFFAIEGINFVYEFMDGRKISELSLTKINSRVALNDPSVMKLSIPGTYVERDCGGSSCVDDSKATNFYLGYFGTPVTSILKSCYPSAPSGQLADNSTYVWLDAANTIAVGWDPSGTDTADNLSRRGGGVSESTCVAETEYEKKLTLDLAAFINNGLNEVATFEGPFKRALHAFTDSNCDHTSTSAGCYDVANSSLTVKAELLPGVLNATTPDKFKGVEIFVKSPVICNDGDCYEEIRDPKSDGYLCGSLTSKNYVSKGVVTTASISKTITGIVLEDGQTALAVLCPYRINGEGVKVFYNTGTAVYGLNNSGGGGNSFVDPTSLPNVTLWFDGADPSTFFTDSACSTPANNGNDIGCWWDKSGANKHANVTAGPNYPTYSTTYGGGAAFTQNPSTILAGSFGSFAPNDVTIFITKVQTDDAEPQRFFKIQAAGSSYSYDQMYVGTEGSSGGLNYLFGDQSAMNYSAGTIDFTPTPLATETVAVRHSGTDAFMDPFDSNSQPLSANTTPYDATAINISGTVDFYIGSDPQGSGLNGQILEIIVYDRALPDTEIELVNCYLRNKWQGGSSCP